MKLYCVQLDIVWENKRANFSRVEALLHSAAPERGSLVLLPEMFATGFSMNVARVRDGREQETDQFLAATAKRLGIYLMGGLVTAGPRGKGRNQAAIYTPDGAELARYTKLQPFTPGGESRHYQAGQSITMCKWRGFNLAPFICYDLRFPEHFRAATRRGAQLITVIASWPIRRIAHWVTLLQSRAIENQAYVAGVNRCGTDPQFTYSGRSLIVSPRGDILADAGNGESIINAELDLSELLACRKELPFLKDMRAPVR